jgi:hypothetical protein
MPTDTNLTAEELAELTILNYRRVLVGLTTEENNKRLALNIVYVMSPAFESSLETK